MTAQPTLFDPGEDLAGIESFLHYRDLQAEWCASAVDASHRVKSAILVAATGTGKCLARGTRVLMFDGTTKAVEDVLQFEKLMGPDSKPRTVLGLASGREMLYRVTPTKGESYTVNESHILSLKLTPKRAGQGSEVVNVSVLDYLKSNRHFKHRAKGYRVGVEFAETELPISPYFLGLWLADGETSGSRIHSVDPEVGQWLARYADELGLIYSVYRDGEKCPAHRITNARGEERIATSQIVQGLRALGVYDSKHIPQVALSNSRAVRLELLAGLIDGDGHLNCGGYEYSSTVERLADGVLYLARSLGLAAYKAPRVTRDQNGTLCDSFRVSISGDCSAIPCKIERKKAAARRQKKDVLVTGIKVEAVGVGDYFGFEIDGDKLFLLADFTVTHNTPFAAMVARAAQAGEFSHVNPNSKSVLFICHTLDLVAQAARSLAKLLPELRVEIEQGENYSDSLADVVVACRKSLAQQRRLDRLGADRFCVGIPDEAHRYLLSSAEWFRIRKHFGCFWLGVTATPDPSSGVGLEESFEECIGYYPMERAIGDGWLVPVHQRFEYMEGIELDPGSVLAGGDWSDAEVAEQMEREHPMAAVASCAVKYGTLKNRWRDSRQVMVFCASVAHARKVAELINRWHRQDSKIGRAGTLYSAQDTKERAFNEASFRAGDLRYLCVMNIGIEGFDHDGVAVGINARLTKSRLLVEQAAGRIVRPLVDVRAALSDAADAGARRRIIAASDKPGAMFIDMTGTNAKLTLGSASLIDILSGRRSVIPHTPFDEDWILKVKKKSMDAGGLTDLAQEMLAEQELARDERKAQIKAAEEKQISLWADTRYKVKLKGAAVDPFDLFDVRLYPATFKASRGGPTAGQQRALVNQGFDREVAAKLTRTQAGKILDVMGLRRKAGLCTYKMASMLQKFGYDPNLTFEEAARVLDTLAKNNWKVPEPVEVPFPFGETG